MERLKADLSKPGQARPLYYFVQVVNENGLLATFGEIKGGEDAVRECLQVTDNTQGNFVQRLPI